MMVDVSTIIVFVTAVVSGVLGAMVATAWLIHSLRKGRLVVKSVELPRQVIEIDKLKVNLTFSEQDGVICLRAAHEVTADGAVASLMQEWLDNNGLVLNFKSLSNPHERPVKKTPSGP